MAQWTLKDGIEGATIQFTSDFMKSGAISAISTLCFLARNIGAQNPQLVNVYGNSTEEGEAYARELLLNSLFTGKLPVAKFVEQVVIHVATQVAYDTQAREAAKAAAGDIVSQPQA